MVSPCLALAEEDVVLAKIGDTKITMADLNRIISYYDADKQKALAQNPTFKATILQRIVQGIVISKIARDEAFDKRPAIAEQLTLLSNDYLASEYIKLEVIDKIKVTEDDMQLYYKAHQEDFKTRETVRARQILIKFKPSASAEDKKKARAKAEEILEKAKRGEDFAKLASEFSDDAGSKTKGGDLGFFPKGKMAPELDKVAFSLKPGEVSDIIETASGCYLIKVEDKKESVLEPYDKVKDKIKEKVFADFKKARVDEFVEKAMKDSGTELNLTPFFTKR
jgi:parvulin-like peptidyl-prolyl isomerase